MPLWASLRLSPAFLGDGCYTYLPPTPSPSGASWSLMRDLRVFLASCPCPFLDLSLYPLPLLPLCGASLAPSDSCPSFTPSPSVGVVLAAVNTSTV